MATTPADLLDVYGTTTVSAQPDDRVGRAYDRVTQFRLSDEQVEWLRLRSQQLNVSQGAVLRNLIDSAMIAQLSEPERLKREIREALDRDDYEEAAQLNDELRRLNSTP